MLGANLLRHAHATFDRRGDQFIVRRQDPSPPPDASRVPLFYMRGGGMLMHAGITQADANVALLTDSARLYPVFLTDAAWQKAGVDPKTLSPFPGMPDVKRGVVPTFRLGGFDLAKLPAVAGIDSSEMASFDVDLAGVVGAELLAFFRVTLADEGRFMWLEPDPTLVGALQQTPARPGSQLPPSAPPPAGSPPPPASTAPSAGPSPAPPASARPAQTKP
jgi:hypothetical protein